MVSHQWQFQKSKTGGGRLGSAKPHCSSHSQLEEEPSFSVLIFLSFGYSMSTFQVQEWECHLEPPHYLIPAVSTPLSSPH